MNPTATACIATSLPIPKSEHAIGISNNEPPATPEDPHAAKVAVMHNNNVESINKNLGRVSVFLLVVAALLILISMSLINNTVRLSVYSRRFIINTMKLVGAQWSFIRKPFMKRSFWIGLYSALLAIGVLIGGLQWAGGRDEVVKQYVTPSVMCIIALVVLAFGLLISMACTYLSVTHYLKTHENKLY